MPADTLLLTVVVIWSSLYPINRYGVTRGFDPIVFSGLRYLIAAIAFTAITLKREGSIRPRREDLLVLGVFAILASVVNQIAFFYAIHFATASVVALAYGTLPVCVGLIGIAQKIARPTPRHWLATLVSFGGVALVAIGGATALSGELGGILLAVLAVVLFGLFTISLSRLSVHYSVYRLSALISLGVVVPMLAAGAHGFATMHWGDIGAVAWGSLAYSTVIGVILSNILWIAAVKSSGPNRSSLYANLQVFGGTALGVLLLDEVLSGLQLAGGAVIAAGIVLSTKRLRATRSSSGA